MAVFGLLLSMATVWPQRSDPAQIWAVAPATATVGDTIWLERTFVLPAGWRLRAGRLDGDADVESIGDPVVTRRGTGWTVRYPVTAWTPGTHRVQVPTQWQLGPDGEADSIAASVATFALQSVIPSSDTAPVPRAAALPLRMNRRNPLPLLLALGGAGLSLAAAWWWRRRSPRQMPTPTRSPFSPGTFDSRWMDAGEPRAVAARAVGRLRGVLARLVPEAHRGLPTSACLETVRQRRPGSPLDELEAVLEALDRQAFAATPVEEIQALARRADALAERLQR
jgi:hypothetical protein